MLSPPPPPPLLPCPLAAGWEILARTRLPRTDEQGRPSGGFSAAFHEPERGELLLVSDAPRGVLAGWRLRRRGADLSLHPTGTLPLRGTPRQPLPTAIDAEGLVIEANQAWVVSEGRRRPDRPAQLLRFDRHSGALLQSVPLPPAWRAAPGRGLEANGGPESLTLLRTTAQEPPLLLLAAEQPLRQDPPDRVRLLGWPLSAAATTPPGDSAAPSPWVGFTPLRLPGRGWGLTDLLALPPGSGATGLLALLRRFEPPDRWEARLALYPLPSPAPDGAAGPPLEPLASWDLLATGLPPDNWEAITPGPRLGEERASLLLASDDNFNPLQENHLVEIAPRRSPACPPAP
jgi:hypothetical protein